MTRHPGRHSERNFRAAEQHYNAALLLLLLLLLLLRHLNSISIVYLYRITVTGSVFLLPFCLAHS